MGAGAAAGPQVGPVVPGVPGGSVTTFDVGEYFCQQLDYEIADLERETGFAESEWFKVGYKGVQDRQWWYANGPAMCQDFLDWYDSNPDVEVWITPDGKPAIELELTVMFGTVPVHMFIDLVLKIGSALVVVDLKSGAKAPENNNQLSVYASGIELEYGEKFRPRYGAYYMLRGVGRYEEDKQYLLTPVELSGYQHSVDWWTRQFTMLDKAVESRVFIARPGEHCKRCAVAYACPAVGGKDAWRFDQDTYNFESARGKVIVI